MSRPWKPNKKTVELEPAPRPSRIRRDPVPADEPRGLASVDWTSREREVRLAVVGIIIFALALCAIAVAVSSYAGWSPSQYTVNLSANE
jgi:hypothetical protein